MVRLLLGCSNYFKTILQIFDIMQSQIRPCIKIFQSSFAKARSDLFNNVKSIQIYEVHSLFDSADKSKTVKQIHSYWKKKFDRAGILQPKSAIDYILAHIFQTENVSEVYKRFSVNLTDAEIQKIHDLCELRIKRMPIQYILGEWNFFGLILKMQAPVFIPRPETEELVNIVLKYLAEHDNQNILEICCGSGAISLALLKSNPDIKITALDQSIEACELTKKNARIHQLDKRLNVIQYEVSKNNTLQELEEKFDVIVTNPPYVPTEQVCQVQPEIKLYEDLAALDGGPDGTLIIKSILILAGEKLVCGGKLFIELDPSHPELIEKHVLDRPELGLKYLQTYKDFCEKDRFVLLEKV